MKFATNEDLTEWSYAMQEPGRHAAERTFYEWSGDATDPDHEPETIVLQTQKIEMDLYHIHIYEGSNQVGRETIHGPRRRRLRLDNGDAARCYGNPYPEPGHALLRPRLLCFTGAINEPVFPAVNFTQHATAYTLPRSCPLNPHTHH